MKKLIYFVIAIMFLSIVPTVTYAQSDDPFEQQTLKANSYGSTKREKKITRKKGAETETPQAPAQAPAPKKEVKEEAKPANEMTISNPCDDWLDFELVSVVGSKGAQTVKITGKITNHGMNKNIEIGRRFLAYDCDGEEHEGWSYSYSCSYNTITDVPVKFVITIPGKINPTTTKVMPVISFDIANCRIEMKNVPITWK